MAYQQIQAHTNALINSRIIIGDYGNLATKWFINNQSSDFDNIWVIIKNTTTSQTNLYCGKNVPWVNTHFNIPSVIPNLILVIENSIGKGYLIGQTIMDLIQLGDMGMFLWITPIYQPVQFTNPVNIGFLSPPVPSGGICINAGGTLMQLPVGGTVQVIKHGQIPNIFQPLNNISHFRVIRRY